MGEGKGASVNGKSAKSILTKCVNRAKIWLMYFKRFCTKSRFQLSIDEETSI
ncbi:hypothetical protein IAD21_04821 [Abditibacteriota bacterium]|nr:hypothetical protein IAD21_04821 [Abditibacteriota bacterium]